MPAVNSQERPPSWGHVEGGKSTTREVDYGRGGGLSVGTTDVGDEPRGGMTRGRGWVEREREGQKELFDGRHCRQGALTPGCVGSQAALLVQGAGGIPG